MKLTIKTPKQSINKAYLKEKVNRIDIELFKKNLSTLLFKINEQESEEHLKNLVADFLKDTWYREKHEINTKDRQDLVIHSGKTTKEGVSVIMEVKKPGNKGEMISEAKPNAKAMHELILYYLRERNEHNNIEIRNLVITNIYEWFIIDEVWFEKNIFRNAKLKKDYESWKHSGKDTRFFYESIAKPLIDGIEENISCTFFDLRDFTKIINNIAQTEDIKLIALYKALSPVHLLKQPYANDSNSLDTKFYTELLHIIGLEEVKEKGNKLIKRKEKPDNASLLENTIIKLEDRESLRNLNNLTSFGIDRKEQLYNVALELCITWVNRILFLKLLEAQLFRYQRHNKEYLFLNNHLIFDYDELSNLFFNVLAEEPSNRRPHLKEKFKLIPYLNSSLFERTELERQIFDISALDNRLELCLHDRSVLKKSQHRSKTTHLSTLKYFFEFLDAYDFSSEGTEQIQEENKNLINASVLGLIFEKINGYKDGSYFTPGFITMYMCRETLRRAVVEKFRDIKGWQVETFEALYNKIDDKKEANEIINSLKICDPAVGSGHFLVSALNEMIAIKSELKILVDSNGKTLRDYHLEVINDELIITDEDSQLVDYNPRNKESQRIQEALFHEKETIIENCLFGVDINPNSVKICRLRLWIELLKSAYYKEGEQLETLPNIDINIKCGNSLISRFALDEDLSQSLKNSKWSIDSYKLAVTCYRNAEGKQEKREMEDLIHSIKKDFNSYLSPNDKRYKDLSKKRGELFKLTQTQELFFEKKKNKEWKKKVNKINNEISGLEYEIEEIKNNRIYENAFEWRFEFPEVLDDNGNYTGFDVIIGNPPYIALQKMKEEQNVFERMNYETYSKLADVYCLFYEKGIQLLRRKGLLTYITSNSWMRTKYGELLRKFFSTKTNPVLLLNIEDAQVFEEATVESNIIIVEKAEWRKQLKAASLKEDFNTAVSLQSYFSTNSITILDLPESGWSIGTEFEVALKAKVEKGSKLIKDFDYPINYGLKTGFNPAFFISTEIKNKLTDKDPQSKNLFKPALRGKDIFKYNYLWKDVWVILIKQGWTNENKQKEDAESFFSKTYPSVYHFMKTTGEKIQGKGKGLFERDDMGDYWWELRPCAYYNEFEKEKIVWGELSDEQKFCFDDSCIYANNTIFFITGNNLKYLISILNSKLAKWYFNIISTSSGMGTNRWLKYKIEQLPIKDISVQDQEPFVNIVNEILTLKRDKFKMDVERLENKLDKMVYELYGLTIEEISIVENNNN